MTVAFDTTFLSFLFNPATKPRTSPSTNTPVSHCALRVEALVDDCSKRGETIIIPAPCLTEILVGVPDFRKAVSEIERSGTIEIASFDARCAIDLADFTRKQIASGVKKSDFEEPYQRIKFDRQIAVIASVNRVRVFFTDDSNQATFARDLGLTVKHTWDLDLPPTYAQKNFLDPDQGNG